ncbi:MAG: hypothetical protein MRY79_03430 [Alphaproteobacteria bacterium]|nr:hypothetical protein [Alphaproteobacteria bacterium]
MNNSFKSILKGSTALTEWSVKRSLTFGFMQIAGLTGVALTLYLLKVPPPDFNNLFSLNNFVTLTEALSKAGTNPFTVGVGGYFMGRWAIGRPLLTLGETIFTKGAGIRYGAKEMTKNVARIVIGVPSAALTSFAGLSLSSLFSKSAAETFSIDQIMKPLTNSTLFTTTRDYSVENILKSTVEVFNQTANVILHTPAAIQNGDNLAVMASFTCAATLGGGIYFAYKAANKLGDWAFGKNALSRPKNNTFQL